MKEDALTNMIILKKMKKWKERVVKELHIHFCWIMIVEFGDENPRNCG